MPPNATIRVLLVDDDEPTREQLKENLGLRGFEVHTAGRADEALIMLQRTCPDAVVLDFALVGGDSGLDVLKRIREVDEFIPVVLYSGAATEEHKADLVHERITFILEKGSKPAALDEVLRQVVASRDEIVAALEKWARDNPSANHPFLVASDGKTQSMNEALAEIRRGSPLGRSLLEKYRLGVAEMLAAPADGGKEDDGDDA